MMTQTKNFVMRQRLNREMQFTDDFRKRFMTKDYGNYDKYEKNKVEVEYDKGLEDKGVDTFNKNLRNMTKQLHTKEGKDFKEKEAKFFEDILSNEKYANDTVPERYANTIEQSNNLQ